MINFAKPIYFPEQWIAFQYFFPRCVNLKLKFYDFHQNLGIVNLNHLMNAKNFQPAPLAFFFVRLVI